ncbi:hypothetical protein [Paraburkholderia sp. BR14320]
MSIPLYFGDIAGQLPYCDSTLAGALIHELLFESSMSLTGLDVS